MTKAKITIPAVLHEGAIAFNCGITVLGEFDAGHRVKDFSRKPLTTEQWMAVAAKSILGRASYRDMYGYASGRWICDDPPTIVMSCRKDQEKYGFSAGNFSKFLESKGAKVTKHVGKGKYGDSTYNTYTVNTTARLCNALAKWKETNEDRIKVKTNGGVIW